MPRKNTEHRHKRGVFHIYNRGKNGRLVFRDDRDRREFLSFVGRFAAEFAGQIDVHAHCPMGTHFHLVVQQKLDGGLARFMAALMTAYVMYFNRRHGTRGPLFDGPYRARRLKTPKEFRWVVGYVHDNHSTGVDYEFSSHRAYLDDDLRPGWLDAEPAIRQFGGRALYLEYLASRDQRKDLQSKFFDLD